MSRTPARRTPSRTPCQAHNPRANEDWLFCWQLKNQPVTPLEPNK